MSYVIVLVAMLTRFLPHVPNFSPAFAALLFGGAHLRKRDSVWYPLALLAASDIVLTTFVYGMKVEWDQCITWLGFALVALIGNWLRKRQSIGRACLAAIAGTTAFFFISNFGVWLGGRLYPPMWKGLTTCYVAALPFYRNSLLSGIAYTALLFGAYELYCRAVKIEGLNQVA